MSNNGVNVVIEGKERKILFWFHINFLIDLVRKAASLLGIGDSCSREEISSLAYFLLF